MKTIYLTRHAKSSWNDPEQSDFERPLNNRGKFDAPLMGSILKEKGIIVELMLSSSSRRTTDTAKIMADKLEYDHNKIKFKDELYLCSHRTILEQLIQLDRSIDSAMFFLHNPGITMIANYLQNELLIENVPTCGIVCIQFESNWEDIERHSGKCLFFEKPKDHK